jgi:hypothetical protein
MLVAELLKSDDPQSPLKGAFTPRKLVAWTQPVTLADVKAIGAPVGAKVNDVLVAAMTGALRKYLLQKGVKVNHTTLRAMVPVTRHAASSNVNFNSPLSPTLRRHRQPHRGHAGLSGLGIWSCVTTWA